MTALLQALDDDAFRQHIAAMVVDRFVQSGRSITKLHCLYAAETANYLLDALALDRQNLAEAIAEQRGKIDYPITNQSSGPRT